MIKLYFNALKCIIITVTTEGCAHAQNARILFMPMRINPDLGTFAPLFMHMRIIAKIRFLAHAHLTEI